MSIPDLHTCDFKAPSFECSTCGLYVMEYVEGLEDRCEAAEGKVAQLQEAMSLDASPAVKRAFVTFKRHLALLDENKRLRAVAEAIDRFAAHPNGWTAETFAPVREALKSLQQSDSK